MCSFSTLASVTVNKDTNKDIILDVSEVYVLGDNDTLTDAKAINIEQAKKSASDYAGTYVESELKLLDGKITKQQVRVLTAGFMEVISRTDKREINKSGSIQLNTKAKIKLSKQSIKESIAKLKTDPERQDKIKSLSDDNKRLRNKLIELTKKINTGASRKDLVAAREEILKDLNKNRSTAKQVFEKGTLLQLAELDNQEYELAKKDIDENLFGYFENEIDITISKPKFVKMNNDYYSASVYVSWNLKRDPVRKLFSKYFDVSRQMSRWYLPYSLYINYSENKGNSQKLQYTKKLFNYIRSHKIWIAVTLGYRTEYVPLSYFSNDDLIFQFSNDSKTQKMVSNDAKNPLVIYKINDFILKNANSIDAKVVVERLN